MDAIISIQSHVVYGYVGNKAAVYPLQSMGFDVWPINTVQFSNHTGYGEWQGEIFSAKHIMKLVDGIFAVGQEYRCRAILSGYMGSKWICDAVYQIVQKFKNINKEVIYLCDPVIGNGNCYVKPEVLKFFKNKLLADIITPNQYEAETLSGIQVQSKEDLKDIANYFHNIGIKIVVITGIRLSEKKGLNVFASYEGNYLIINDDYEYNFETAINGTGDLFSSIFLGAYIKYNNVSTALQYATFYLQKVLKETMRSNEKEIQILSFRYDTIKPESLPQVEVFL